MPSISTHANLARIVIPRLAACDGFCFVLGTLAPDCFDRSDEASFRAHHFVGAGRDSDLVGFLAAVCPLNALDLRQSSFAAGYYAHLWLDNYARVNEDALAAAQADAPPALIRENLESANLLAVAGFLPGIEPAAWVPAAGLEFVSVKEVTRSWERLLAACREVGRQPQPVWPDLLGLYERFLLDAADRLLAALPAALTPALSPGGAWPEAG